MKTYKSLSPEILAFTVSHLVKGTRKVMVPNEVEGQPDVEKDEEVTETKTINVAMSQGAEADLPEDNEHVKGLVIKGHLRELTKEELEAKNAKPEEEKTEEEEEEQA